MWGEAEYISADDFPTVVVMFHVFSIVIREVIASKVIVQYTKLKQSSMSEINIRNMEYIQLTNISITKPSKRKTRTMELIIESQWIYTNTSAYQIILCTPPHSHTSRLLGKKTC